jgi:predicted ATPase with chaperone activity
MVADLAGEIAAAVARREAVDGIRIVGVDGPSGSGKTYLASRLSDLMPAPVIPRHRHVNVR